MAELSLESIKIGCNSHKYEYLNTVGDIMNRLRNEHGIALVTALLLTLVTLVIVMALMYFIESGVRTSASSKRYKNVRQAAYGGISLTANELVPRLQNAILGNYSSGSQSAIQALKNDYASSALNFQNLDCLKQKLNTITSKWSSTCSNTLDPKTAPDMTFTLKSTLSSFTHSNQGYVVYAKIVDTAVVGNTDPADSGYGGGGGWRKGENVNESNSGGGLSTGGGGGGVTIPSIYRMDIRAEMQQNPLEKTELSVVYAY